MNNNARTGKVKEKGKKLNEWMKEINWRERSNEAEEEERNRNTMKENKRNDINKQRKQVKRKKRKSYSENKRATKK